MAIELYQRKKHVKLGLQKKIYYVMMERVGNKVLFCKLVHRKDKSRWRAKDVVKFYKEFKKK